MKSLRLGKEIICGIFLFCFFVLFPITKTFGFGEDLGEHCWQRDSTGITIKHQITRMGNMYLLNGIVTLSDGTEHPAVGTAFFN